MADDFDFSQFITSVDATPAFESPPEMENIPVQEGETAPDGAPPKKRRGRPPGSKNKTTTAGGLTLVPRRDQKEVAVRLGKMMTGGTGIIGVIRPHVAMTDEEARDIAEPLSAYLLRQEQYSAHVREFIDRWDLFAAGIAVLAYIVRVWSDDEKYRQEKNAAKQQRPTRERSATAKSNASESTGERPRESENQNVAQFPQIIGGDSGISAPFSPRG